MARNDLEGNLLESDFNQCFEQARHYYKIALEIIKYAFAGYMAVMAGSYALFRFGLEIHLDSSDFWVLLIVLLLSAFSMGLIFLWIIVRNRCHFVLINRYINEIRGFYIKKNVFEFKNNTRMHMDYKNPPYYDPYSTHSWAIYLISILNTSLFFLMMIFWNITFHCGYEITSYLTVSILPLQIGCSIYYLLKKEGQSADEIIFGKKEA